MKRIAPIQGLTLIFLIGLILLVLFFKGQLPLWRSLLFQYTVLLGILFIIKLSSDRGWLGRTGTFFQQFSPMLFIISIYESLGNLIQHLQPDIDSLLAKMDYHLFGVHPTVWIERYIVPWFTDVMSFCYVSYYFLPVILILTLYLKNRIPEFNQSFFVLALGYYISFVGYILFPAIGPRYTLTHLQSVPLTGSILTDLVRDVLNAIEHNKRDCMPSGHTQISLMLVYLAYRFEKVLFYIYVPMVSGLILSTVYLRYHYVVDLFAGTALAILCLLVAPRLYRWWGQQQKD